MELQVGVKILLKNKEGKYLFLYKNPKKYLNDGSKWEIAGGRIDPGSSLLQNLRREVLEETGLEIKGEPKLISAQDIFPENGRHVVRLTYLGFGDGVVKLSDEHTDFKWLSVDEIKKLEPIEKILKEILEKNL